MKSASILAEIMWQAAVAVGHHAKSTPCAAIREGVLRTLGEHHAEAYQYFREGNHVYMALMGRDTRDASVFTTRGPSWAKWLDEYGRKEMTTALLFVYEYIVQEMLGDRVTIH